MTPWRRYPWLAVDEAPECPGVYAWYTAPDPGAADSESIDTLGSFLAEATRPHSLPSLEGDVRDLRGAFGIRWNGVLDPIDFPALPPQIAFDAALTAETPDRPFDDIASRRALLEVIRVAAPILAAPLYIGKTTTSLRTRLETHVQKYARLKDGRDRLGVDPKLSDLDFATRAYMEGISPDSLVVYALPLPELPNCDDLDVQTMAAVVTAAEHVLNRWYLPRFGRR